MRRIEEFQIEFEYKPSAAEELLFDLFDSAKTAIIAVFLLFMFVVRFAGVEGGSMFPTLSNGDWLAVEPMTSEYSHGDIVIINQPWEKNVPIVKRIIAVGGDKVDIDFDLKKVYVNGEEKDEPYIAEKTSLKYDMKFPLTVEEGKVFVMGDNRNDSLDSRSTKIGLIDERYILGKAKFRILPLGHFNIYKGENEDA